MANEVITDECTVRMSLILEETPQPCELWRNCRTEDLFIAETSSTSLSVRETAMAICTKDHACMNDTFTQCNMEEPNIILTSQQQQELQLQELSKGKRHCRGSPRPSWCLGWR
ncbi:hypothetical protein LSM04_009577 [Trypanosoma melophagium]|uniref:uncharacterized protein n=1 Tax=Trypanosoma melophagium TaxID=715481 RepID=UPI00351AB0EC|nr:hypothetical protein LSM04_009577 [Trypanosoma melophagium]